MDVGTAEIWDQQWTDANNSGGSNDIAIRVDQDGAGAAYGFVNIATIFDQVAMLNVGSDIIV